MCITCGVLARDGDLRFAYEMVLVYLRDYGSVMAYNYNDKRLNDNGEEF